ncbi:uncharacterized protein LOC113756182, partial [Coffea eugenioides]|uniref:uncharacterized protein LOC113756182 n=1 Tax=Coffea eugenioides TaxID=49369 RepID=UPI000F60C9D5
MVEILPEKYGCHVCIFELRKSLELLQEWGDPRKEEFYFYMKSYSPVDNVKAQNYPAILVTAGLNDPRVMYSEAAKYVAKLRDTKTDNNLLLFKCELGAGHFSKSGRFEKLQEDALTYAFFMKALDMVSAAIYLNFYVSPQPESFAITRALQIASASPLFASPLLRSDIPLTFTIFPSQFLAIIPKPVLTILADTAAS